MSRPTFAAVRSGYPQKRLVSQHALYTELGYPDRAVGMAWVNTCAIRVSVALVRAGLRLQGQTTIKAGAHKGLKIEHNVRRLANHLALKLGPPEKYKGSKASKAAIAEKGRKGIVAFFRLYGVNDEQNHIDVVGPGAGGYAECSSDCYWGAMETWFWPLR